MLRLAFDFIITWRETRTRPNAYAEIILYNSANSEMLRIPISRYQRGSEMNIPIDYLEMGSYTLEIVTASGEHWYGYFEYVASDTLSL